MTSIRLFVLTLLICAFAAGNLQAQGYEKAVGLRLGYPVSATYKMFLNDSNNAIEAFVGYRSDKVLGFGWSWINVGAGYQVHNDLSSVTEGLQWYYGGGASVYFWSFDDGFSDFADESSLAFGILGFLGLDYKFANAPVNISIDWVPSIFLNGYGSGFGADNGALAVRYTFQE